MHVRRTSERGRLRAVQIKLAEALEEITTHLPSKTGLDHEVRPRQWTACPETAIEHHAAEERVSKKRQQCNCAKSKQLNRFITTTPIGDNSFYSLSKQFSQAAVHDQNALMATKK